MGLRDTLELDDAEEKQDLPEDVALRDGRELDNASVSQLNA